MTKTKNQTSVKEKETNRNNDTISNFFLNELKNYSSDEEEVEFDDYSY